MKNADGGEPGRAGVTNERGVPLGDPANRDDRQRRTDAHLRQRLEPRHWMAGGLAFRRKDGAEQQIVAPAIRDCRVHLRDRMDRSADQERLGRRSLGGGGRHPGEGGPDA